MTYGKMPERGEFDFAFQRECPHGLFEIRHGAHHIATNDEPPAGDYSRDELWSELNALVGLGTDESLSWASDILGVLGFEWI